MIRERVKWAVFPGLNLHARLRNRLLPKFFLRPQNGDLRTVLDAGCGNGMLAYQSYKLGNTVIGVSIKDEVQRNRKLFNDYLGIPEDRLSFRDVNLYDIESIGQQFDEIICTEVMEHIKGDVQVCTSFFRILKPGGVLHICCPNAEHPTTEGIPSIPMSEVGKCEPATPTTATSNSSSRSALSSLRQSALADQFGRPAINESPRPRKSAA